MALLLSAPLAHAQEDDLSRARFFDQQGVRAFVENRFRDAMALFKESYLAGGPPTELWNVARCQLKLEDTAGAAETLATYLGKKGLAPDDRREAKRLLDEIEHRPSTFVVASVPSGAQVTVDGHPAGATPLASTLAPGPHQVVVSRPDAGTTTRTVDARYGHPIVLDVDLEAGNGPSTPDHKPVHKHAIRRLSVELVALGAVTSMGGAALGLSPVGELTVGYAPLVFRHSLFGVGVRFQIAGDTWSTSPGVSNTVASCTLPNDYSAAELTFMPTVFGAFRLGRFTLGGHLGFGGAVYVSSSNIGGDVYAPSCAFGGAAAPDVYAALDLSFRATEALRLMFVPASFDLHGSYDGARTGSADATGPWVRFGVGIGAALDL